MSKRIIVIGSIACALLLDAFAATVISANAHRRSMKEAVSAVAEAAPAADLGAGRPDQNVGYYSDLRPTRLLRRHAQPRAAGAFSSPSNPG